MSDGSLEGQNKKVGSLKDQSIYIFVFLFFFIKNIYIALLIPEIEVSFELWSWAEVKKCGVHIVVDESKAIGRYGSADQYCVYSDTVSGDMVPEGVITL